MTAVRGKHLYSNVCIAQHLEATILELNQKAMMLLQQGNVKQCIEVLRQCEAVVLTVRQIKQNDNDKLFSLTLNNFACYYKK